jgi:hypothetical protein
MESPFRKPIGATLIAGIQFTALPIRAQNVGAKNARTIQITNTTAPRPGGPAAREPIQHSHH